jgi:4-O-beta-D-mannosyl-D-glucose phosphorylase
MNTEFKARLKQLEDEHQQLITKKNKKEAPGHGRLEGYDNPVLTGDHAPLFWKYDLNPDTNPFLIERFGIHAAFNAGAMKYKGKYI